MNVWGDRLVRVTVYVTAVVIVVALLVVGLSVHTVGMVPVLAFVGLWWARPMPTLDDELAAFLAWESA